MYGETNESTKRALLNLRAVTQRALGCLSAPAAAASERVASRDAAGKTRSVAWSRSTTRAEEQEGHTPTPSVTCKRTPQLQTHPVRRAGTPMTRAWSGTSRVTTAPAATKAYSPTVTPQTMVAFAPSVAPRRTSVL